MAVIVEHDKRKAQILDKSLELFCKFGYDDVTFQKIASECAISRTTLYIYFKNKREIFVWSIKRLTERVEREIYAKIGDKKIGTDDCLKDVVCHIVKACCDHHRLFQVLLPYLLSLGDEKIPPAERVRRRVIKIRHFLNIIVIRGQDEGIFKKCPIKTVSDLFYSLIESTMYRIAIMDDFCYEEIENMVKLSVDGICIK